MQNGARIVCVDVDEDRANDIATEVGNDAVPWVGDVTKRGGVERLFDDAGKVFGGKLNGFVASVSGTSAAPRHAAYGAAKALSEGRSLKPERSLRG